jgi:lysophospholipase L1-like esterase
MRPVLSELGLPVVDTADRVQSFLRGQGGGSFKGSSLTLGDDPHPSPAGHALIADALVDYLEGSGFLTHRRARSEAAQTVEPPPSPKR